MIITNCKIIYLDKIEEGSVLIEDGKIKKINPEIYGDSEVFDAEGLFLAPGFIDVHIHGAGGYDTMDGTTEALNVISKSIMEHGTTSFLPTTMTVDVEEINKAMKAIKQLKEEGTDGANILGCHLEGPFISPKAIGAQNPNYLLEPTIENYEKMIEGCEDEVVSITLAPEIPGAKELIYYLSKKGVVCSAGHTKATYNEIIEAIKYGLSHSTHLYNAMTGFNHREPGTVGAIFDSEITTETIADGIHIAYPALKLAYKVKTTDKVMLVSDSMMACCMKDGRYSLGGQQVDVVNGAARLKNGSLAGSVLTIDKAIENIYKNCDIPLYEAVKMATYNPAKHCKVEMFKGLIKKCTYTELILFKENIQIKKIFINVREKYST